MDAHHGQQDPAPTIVAWRRHVAANARVLDVAAGGGRHARWFADLGCEVTAVDRDVDALRAIADQRIHVVEADLEAGPWPLGAAQFDVVVVVNYLWRPLLPRLAEALTAGGVLMYETFMVGNERFGRPRNPDFLLRPGELRAFADEHGLEILAFDEGPVGDPPAAVRQRLLGRRPVA
ncbi:MAG: class I SAM-dependent methyltransferase [Planctomycetes bacterium]|nr:class I SAM-dependent methyltransferase [Planctomycetota bacterium]